MLEEPCRGFLDAEYKDRTKRAQALMDDQHLAGLLLMSEPEVRYFSGFQTLFWQSPTRPWFLFIPATGDPIAIIPEIGKELMQRTWLTDIRTWSAPNPKDDGLSLLTELLSPLAKQGYRLGILKGHETSLRMPLGDYERLLNALPGLEMIDCTPLIRKLRMVKSQAEIEKLAHICAIGAKTFDDIPLLASAGQPIVDVFRSFKRQALKNGADDVPYLVGGADTGGYRDVISPPTNRPLCDGDILMLDTGAIWDGYYCDFDRNFAIGRADDEARRAHDRLWLATEKALEAARPGITCNALFQVMNEVLSNGSEKCDNVGRYGHGLGMQLTEWPSIAQFDDTVIEEGMVLTLEPSISYADDRLMVHEENIVVEASGPRLLTKRAPAELPVLLKGLS